MFSWRNSLALLAAAAATPASAAPTAVFPVPASAVPGAGRFVLTNRTPVVAPPSDRGATTAARLLRDLLARSGLVLRSGSAARGAAISFRRTPTGTAEGYRLSIDARGATISAATDAGLFYGAVSLWQLASADPRPDAVRAIHAVMIDDAPRFAWRGLMLDSARHYQSPAFIRRLIDGMAASKLNTLHWHLVDDQGWRLQIRKYPRLTKIGAFRRPATAPGAPSLPPTGGFYTQEEVRALVAYAAERNVTIVPEIEMPGHALSAIRAYARLGTGVTPPAGIESGWGVFPYLYNTDDATFAFLRDVLDEVMALFPSRFIHVGGDEAIKDQWRASPAVQARMHALGLANEDALQSWFIGRIGAYLQSRGRRMIGWDEILDGGIPIDATIMSWRGLDGALAAARAGHDTVLSPSPVLYLDHRQSRDDALPGRNGVIDLAQVYALDLLPASLAPEQQRHVLGIQANLWTEHVRTEERAAAKAFPRAAAVAHLGWALAGQRDYARFIERLVPQLDRLAALGITASPAAFRPEPTLALDGAAATLSLANGAALPMRYTLDGSAPDARSRLYRGPVALTLPAHVRAVTFADARALPGELDRRYDARSVRHRTSFELASCGAPKVQLALEDDAPASGSRAVFLTDILQPCWRYEQAPLDDIQAIALTVGRIPFNFQVGKDRDAIRFRPPTSPAGEFEVRADRCDGPLVATLPLAPALANPALTTLRAPLALRTGIHDLCITYTATGPDPLWAIDSVQLDFAS